MTSFKGYCERCGNYDCYLREVDRIWLCEECGENQKISKSEILFRDLSKN